MSLKDKLNAAVTDETIAQAIYKHLEDDKLPCAAAFAIAKTQDVSPRQVGQTADALDIRLCRCQLGFFGYPGKTGWDIAINGERSITEHPIPPGLEAALHEAAGAERQITCAQAWALAARFDTPKMLVGYLADQLDIHVVVCQLGAF